MKPLAALNRSVSQEYVNMYAAAFAAGDTNDCAVRAVAVTTGIDVNKVRDLHTAHGRKLGKGTPMSMTRAVIQQLGFEMTLVHPSTFINRYPGAHSNLQNVTTHHPARFNKVWADGERYILHVRGHLAGVVNGEVHDWASKNSKRVFAIYRITPRKVA